MCTETEIANQITFADLKQVVEKRELTLEQALDEAAVLVRRRRWAQKFEDLPLTDSSRR